MCIPYSFVRGGERESPSRNCEPCCLSNSRHVLEAMPSNPEEDATLVGELEPTLVGELVTFTSTKFVYTCSNESLGKGQPNYMKNPNVFDRAIACSFADSVVSCGAMSETTFVVLCPASREWATTKTWLGGTLEALKHFEETSQEVGGVIFFCFLSRVAGGRSLI